ncbi:MAG: hypothetical protein ACI4L5_05595 [Negativibacillus sp.]
MSKNEIFNLIDSLDDEHFILVNGSGCAEVYSNKEFLETPIPVGCCAVKIDKED